MKDQKYIRFPKEVVQFLSGDYTLDHEVVMPLFRELDEREETAFREYTRQTYVVGTPIDEVWHPVCQDEARAMNREAGLAD